MIDEGGVLEPSDALIESIAKALRPLPLVDESAKARVLIAVAAERERDRERGTARVGNSSTRARSRVRAAGLLAAAVLAAVMLRTSDDASEPVVASAVPIVPVTPAAALAGDVAGLETARQPIQLVFRAPAATRVRVVGEFNAWDGSQSPMTRDAESGLWSVTLLLRPGRHVYAFVVDDSLWVRDPRAPAAPDADFGRPGSVLLVGRPR